MNEILDILIAALLIADMSLLASSRLAFCVKVAVLQGFIIVITPLLSSEGVPEPEMIVIAAINLLVKCVALPALFFSATRKANVKREMEPYVGYSSSILIGISVIVAAFWICGNIPLVGKSVSTIALPAAISTIFTGLFVIIARKKALTQALGFLVFENGIYFFGVSLFLENSLIVELGILLDVFTLVLIMGIAIFHISREFDHIDTDKMTTLGDWKQDDGGVI